MQPGNSQWRIEKRDIITGAEIIEFEDHSITDGVYDLTPQKGVVQSNPSTYSSEIPYAIAVDNTYILIGGYENTPGNLQWRIEKRNKTSGSLITSFGTNGVIVSNPSTDSDFLNKIILDDNNLYAVGKDYMPGNNQLRIEKRDATTGSLVTSFEDYSVTDGVYEPVAQGGVVQSNPSTGHDAAMSLTIEGEYIFIAGTDSVPGDNYQWRVEKRDKSTGKLVTSFGTNGVVTPNPSTGDDFCWVISNDENYLYLAGGDFSSGNEMWRIEKRDITTGMLVTTFGPNGVI